jgi:hypothetical protein
MKGVAVRERESKKAQNIRREQRVGKYKPALDKWGQCVAARKASH